MNGDDDLCTVETSMSTLPLSAEAEETNSLPMQAGEDPGLVLINSVQNVRAEPARASTANCDQHSTASSNVSDKLVQRLQSFSAKDQRTHCQRACAIARKEEAKAIKGVQTAIYRLASAKHHCQITSESDPDWFTLDVQDSQSQRIAVLIEVLAKIEAQPIPAPPGLEATDEFKGWALGAFAQTALATQRAGDATTRFAEQGKAAAFQGAALAEHGKAAAAVAGSSFKKIISRGIGGLTSCGGPVVGTPPAHRVPPRGTHTAAESGDDPPFQDAVFTIGAEVQVVLPTLLRAGEDLDSAELCDVDVGQRLMVVNVGEANTQSRSLMVEDRGLDLRGWISCNTTIGKPLIKAAPPNNTSQAFVPPPQAEAEGPATPCFSCGEYRVLDGQVGIITSLGGKEVGRVSCGEAVVVDMITYRGFGRVEGHTRHPINGWVVLLDNDEASSFELAFEGQLITLHAGDPEDNGLITVTLTSMGGDEMADLHVDPALQVSELLKQIDAELDPGQRKFMLPDGRMLYKSDETRLFSEWLRGS